MLPSHLLVSGELEASHCRVCVTAATVVSVTRNLICDLGLLGDVVTDFEAEVGRCLLEDGCLAVGVAG